MRACSCNAIDRPVHSLFIICGHLVFIQKPPLSVLAPRGNHSIFYHSSGHLVSDRPSVKLNNLLPYGHLVFLNRPAKIEVAFWTSGPVTAPLKIIISQKTFDKIIL